MKIAQRISQEKSYMLILQKDTLGLLQCMNLFFFFTFKSNLDQVTIPDILYLSTNYFCDVTLICSSSENGGYKDYKHIHLDNSWTKRQQ